MPLIFTCAYQRKPLGGESVTFVAASYVLSLSLAQKANALRYRSYSKKILHFFARTKANRDKYSRSVHRYCSLRENKMRRQSID